MTPFGRELRRLRAERRVTQAELARKLGVSAAYLSALENGYRGRPTPLLLHRICNYFGIIWDDAEALTKLAARSRPKLSVDTGGLSPTATEVLNLLAEKAKSLDEATWRSLKAILASAGQRAAGPPAAPGISRERNE
ncbi:MAG: helix-turn-helix transcriptional regulator [Thalassobaculales bacterium]